MNPEVEQKLSEMQRKIDELTAFKNAWSSDAELDPQVARTVKKIVGDINLGDLNNVDDTGITNGQLLKYNSSTGNYEPANDIDT